MQRKFTSCVCLINVDSKSQQKQHHIISLPPLTRYQKSRIGAQRLFEYSIADNRGETQRLTDLCHVDALNQLVFASRVHHLQPRLAAWPKTQVTHVKRVSDLASGNRAWRSLRGGGEGRRFPYPLDWRRWSTKGRTRVRHRACTCSCRRWTLAALRTQTHPGPPLLYHGAPPAVKTESRERISGLSLRQLLPQVIWRNVLETHRQTPRRPHVIWINHLCVGARRRKGFSPRWRGDRFCHLNSPRAPRR